MLVAFPCQLMQHMKLPGAVLLSYVVWALLGTFAIGEDSRLAKYSGADKGNLAVSALILHETFVGTPTVDATASRILQASDFDQKWFRNIVPHINDKLENVNRKQWEYVNIFRIAEIHGIFGRGINVLGLTDGSDEPLEKLFQRQKAKVTVTSGWSPHLDQTPPGILDRQTFDFIWSQTPTSRFGVEAAKQAIILSLFTLKPGGVGAYVIDISLSWEGFSEFDTNTLGLWGKKDVEDIAFRVRAFGCNMFPANWALGMHSLDDVVDGEPFLKASARKDFVDTVYTSMVLVFERVAPVGQSLLTDPREIAAARMSKQGRDAASKILWGTFAKRRLGPVEEIVGKLADPRDVFTDWYKELAPQLCEGTLLHRRAWEFVSTARVIRDLGKLGEGKRGIALHVGNQPVSGYLAKRATELIITEPLDGDGNRDATRRECTAHIDDYNKRVQLMKADLMNPPEEFLRSDFDFLFSGNVENAVGNVNRAKQVIMTYARMLRSGGIAVHTIENFAISRLNGDGESRIWTKADVDDIGQRVEGVGLRLMPIHWGISRTTPEGMIVDSPPFDNRLRPHFKLWMDETVVTTMMLVFEKV